ncbi:TPA: hypothetical protein DDW35_07375, partial [Candidatus Sumerlaeota bacterium]|nr:hypothetical protein [Candidatus Sumerlaeota bacterium]
LRKLAEKAKSWNNLEASVGMAAINSVFNAPSAVEANFDISPIEPGSGYETFEKMRNEVRGKKVTVVGHFPNLEALGEVCELSILERNPQRGDFPDPACEYILGEQDYVFITGITMINKTLPRLLELCSKDAKITLVGPTVTLAPLWFERGVTALGGRVVFDPEIMFNQVREGGGHDRFGKCARMVQLHQGLVKAALV